MSGATQQGGWGLAAITDRGLRRSRNQDVARVEELLGPDDRCVPVLLVADGMGGHRAGAEASSLASRETLDTLHQMWDAGPPPDAASTCEALHTAISRANRVVHRAGLKDPRHARMGTTVTMAVILEDPGRRGLGTLVVGHVGDSRAYRVGPDSMELLTHDHSMVARMVADGLLTPDQALRSTHRGILLRALGPSPRVKVDIDTHPIGPHDRVLLCSDGLSGVVSDTEIARIVRSGDSSQAIARDLVEVANAEGGPDNIGVAVGLPGQLLPSAAATLDSAR